MQDDAGIAIRKAAGTEFPGWDATLSALIAEVEMAGEPEYGVRHGAFGISGIGPTGEWDQDGLADALATWFGPAAS